jgi:hypothetical protein
MPVMAVMSARRSYGASRELRRSAVLSPYPASGLSDDVFVLGTGARRSTEFLATGTAVRRLGDEHKLPETSPKPTFTLGLDT